MWRRTNGFQSPNVWQISTYILFLALNVQFAIFLSPTLPPILSIPITSLFGIAAIASTYYTYVTTSTDSIDEQLYEHLRGVPHPNALRRRLKLMKRRHQRKVEGEKKLKKKTTTTMNETGAIEAIFLEGKEKSNAFFHRDGLEHGTFEEENKEEEDLKFCWDCKIDVHVHSLHCQYCAKCVSHFDHHCIWFNTCIGSENYATFYRAVLSLAMFFIIHLATIILYTVLFFTDLWGVRERSGWFYLVSPSIIMGVNVGFAVFVLAIGTIIVQLLRFHWMLRSQKLTTHQYTVKMAKMEREKTDRKSLRELKKTRNRFEEDGRASGGSFIERMRIRMGGMGPMCKPCVPVMKTEEAVNVGGIGSGNIDYLDKESHDDDDGTVMISSEIYQGMMKVSNSVLSLFYEEEADESKRGQRVAGY